MDEDSKVPLTREQKILRLAKRMQLTGWIIICGSSFGIAFIAAMYFIWLLGEFLTSGG